MRCPKCQYISFDDGARCRNCGYDFSLVDDRVPPELPIRRRNESSERLSQPGAGRGSDAGGSYGAGSVTPGYARADTIPGGFDLPLFNDARDDVPLVSASAVPRPPLAVRRSAPVTPRSRPEPALSPPLSLDFPDAPELRQRPALEEPEPSSAPTKGSSDDAAPALLRGLAAAIDLGISGAIDLGVLYLTVQLCDLELTQFRALPLVPMAAFLFILNAGYAAMFTAARGQTIGKMIAGIRIVPASAPGEHARVSLGSAIVRATACAVSVLPIGLGFLLAFLRTDGRSLHDALADTRVVRT